MMTTSPGAIMPRSPWLASAGCMKNAGVPVDASVAASFFAMCPDLPIPETTTRPSQRSISATAATNGAPRRAASAEMAAASVASTSRASLSARAASGVGPGRGLRTAADLLVAATFIRISITPALPATGRAGRGRFAVLESSSPEPHARRFPGFAVAQRRATSSS